MLVFSDLSQNIKGNVTVYFSAFLSSQYFVCLFTPLQKLKKKKKLLNFYFVQFFWLVHNVYMLQRALLVCFLFIFLSWLFKDTLSVESRSQWPRCLRHEMSSPARRLETWVRISLKAWMFVCIYSIFSLSCVGSGLTSVWSPVQGVLPTVCKKLKWNDSFHGCPMLQSGSNRNREISVETTGSLMNVEQSVEWELAGETEENHQLCHFLLHKSDVTWNRTPTTAVKSRWLTAWVMARPCLCLGWMQ
jgi:hypothetical protein